jgi:hypothetical protein
MKNRFESAETFEAYATIDAGYYLINELNTEFNQPIHPLFAAVDKVTGYDKHRAKDMALSIIKIAKDIVAAKKIVEADFSADEKLITDLQTKFLHKPQ